MIQHRKQGPVFVMDLERKTSEQVTGGADILGFSIRRNSVLLLIDVIKNTLRMSHHIAFRHGEIYDSYLNMWKPSDRG